MADPVSPLNAATAYKQYNDMLNQQIAQYSQPRGSDLDPMALFALAQGFLSPTKTGGFAESLGNAAGQAIGPLSRAKQTDQDRMDKVAKLRETQVRLALEQQRLNDLNARAAAGYGGDPILDYSRAMSGLEREASMVGDPNALDIDANTPEGAAEKKRRMEERAAITNQMKALRSRYFSGAGAGAAPAPGGAPAASPPPAPSASVNAAKKGQAGLVPTEEELKNARVKDGVKYIERNGQYYRVEE